MMFKLNDVEIDFLVGWLGTPRNRARYPTLIQGLRHNFLFHLPYSLGPKYMMLLSLGLVLPSNKGANSGAGMF